jgi:archaeal flagellar protein FlaJ
MRPLNIGGFEINRTEIIGLVVAAVIVILSFIFFPKTDLFYFLLGISFFIAGLPFVIALVLEGRIKREKEEMFLEFSRDLVESVKAGTPISTSILNVKEKNYGSLSPYINKLANQISLGIPLQNAFETFARDVNSNTITRSVTIISESEKAGGQISDILDSVVKSVTQIEKLRKERASSIYSLVVQGYIIFFIFIVIMLVMQFKILPIANTLGSGVSGASGLGITGLGGGQKVSADELARPFIWLLIIQGLFAGLVIGKLSEGNLRAGIKHSFVLLVLALLIDSGAKLFLG